MKGIAFFDMEGTLLRKAYHLDDGLVAPSAWTLLAEALGNDCLIEENRTKDAWNKGGYSNYLHWMKDTIDIHIKYGLHKDLFSKVVGSVEIVPGAVEVFSRLRDVGVVTVLISGGFKALADRVQTSLKIDHAFSACEYFFEQRSGLLEHYNLLPADEVGKVDFMRLMCREYSLAPSRCTFVGDGKNDVHLAKEVGLSVSFNGQPELVEVASKKIIQSQGSEDFLPVGELLEDFFLSKGEGYAGVAG